VVAEAVVVNQVVNQEVLQDQVELEPVVQAQV